ncbi:hypothetical protein N7V09_00050 [Shewanella seohaensis]|nr:hypothetical protein [Shewanella seohaensis]UXM83984.1 hypothetical protein N7V09_00050 [Shewanella seohaensis]
MPDPWAAVKERWYLLIPLFILIYLLFSGRTPLFSGMVGLALTSIVILGSAIVLRLPSNAMRFAFFGLPLGCCVLASSRWVSPSSLGSSPYLSLSAGLSKGAKIP